MGSSRAIEVQKKQAEAMEDAIALRQYTASCLFVLCIAQAAANFSATDTDLLDVSPLLTNRMPSHSSLKVGLLSNIPSRVCRDRQRAKYVASFLVLGSTLIIGTAVLSSTWFPSLQSTPPLNVCLITADYWGASAPGGTATAFEILARELQKAGHRATLVGVSTSCERRENFNAAHKDLKSSVFLCEDDLETPLERETFPYEITGLLALQWLRNGTSQKESQCDIVHWHEWGGMAVQGLVASEAGFLPPSQRHIVQLHGGNLWSTQHGSRPIHDMIALRIDANEKLSIELAHEITSPSQYMADWYGARGWKLPAKVSIVPNCLSLPVISSSKNNKNNSTGAAIGEGSAEQMSATDDLIKPVKTVAFFGRLETRKGIEIFFDAISMLPDEILSKPDFRVLVIGGSAHIQSQRSEDWIKNRIKSLPKSLNASQVVLKVGLSREEALKEVVEGETVIAFGSMTENAPFALIEASSLGLPYVTLDTGGVQEVVDLESSSADVPFNPLNLTETTVSLAAALKVRLHAGHAAVPKLRPAYAHGDKLWIEWHNKASREMHSRWKRNQLKKPNGAFHSRRHLIEFPAFSKNINSEIVYLSDGPNALIKLHKDVCESQGDVDPYDIVLLVPDKGIVKINEAVWRQQLLPTLHENLNRKLDAVVLGAKVKNYNINNKNDTVAFSGSPTWTYYSENSLCTPVAPLALRRNTLCGLGLLSRNFQRADAWTLALLFKKSGLQIAPLPFAEAAVLTRWQNKKCSPENLPTFWSFNHDVTANLRYDPQIALFKDLATLGKSPEPLTTFFNDHRHWKVFPEVSPGQNCDDPQLIPPYFCSKILHPSTNSSSIASFSSWFSLDSVNIWGEIRACPSCAEGPITLQVILKRNNILKPEENESALLWSHTFDAGSACSAKVLSVDGIKINTGDEIQVIAGSSSAGHSCAGVYVPRFEIYPSGTAE